MTKMTYAVFFPDRRWPSGNSTLYFMIGLMVVWAAMTWQTQPLPLQENGLVAMTTTMLLVGLVNHAKRPRPFSAISHNTLPSPDRETAALRKSAQKLQMHLDEMPMGAIEWDVDFRVTEWNPNAEVIFGYTREEALGRHAIGLILPTDMSAQILPLWQKLLTGQGCKHNINNNITKSGQTILCDWYNSPLIDADGIVIGVASLVRDITEQNAAELALKASEERYRSVVEHVQEVIFHVDTTGRWTFLNSAWTHITEYTIEESLDRSFTEFIFPEFLPIALEYFHQILAGNLSNLPPEVRARTKSGECKWLELRANLHVNSANEIIGLYGTLGDISEQKKNQDALLRMVSLLTSTIESTADGILAVDLAGTIISYNNRFQQMLTLNHQVWLHQHNHDILDQISELLAEPEILRTRLQDINENPKWLGSDRAELLDGRIFEIFSQPQWLSRIVIGRVWSFRDVTDREKAIEDVRLQREYLRSIIDTDPNLISIKDEQGTYQLVNHAYADAYATTIDDLIGKKTADFNPHQDEVEFFNRTDRDVLVSLQDRFLPEVKFTNAQGEVHWLQTSKRPIYSPDKRTYHVLGIATDITERRNFEQEISHQALHDRLTGLPNRALFMDRLQRGLSQTQTTGGSMSILTLDLDNFKVVNDSLGHHVGDLLLVETARRLQACVAPGDTVARLGGDEFTVILEQSPDRQHAAYAAERISRELHRVVNLAGHEILPTVSMGITICRGDTVSPAEVLSNADTAMYQAKTSGRAGYAFYEPEMNRASIERLELQTDLHRAIDRNELELHFQPIVDLTSGQMTGTEALLRWNHPRLGMILPSQFIPIAEETGLIVSLGDWVLREACIQTKNWHLRHPNYGNLSVSVNVSLYQLKQEEFVDRACQIIGSSGLHPSNVKLEITESVMMQDVETMIARLEALKAYGVRLAIDDFGTGYSCMAYLIRLPIDTIKIDRIFVSRIGERSQDDAVLQSIVSLATALTLEITSEGIENQQQLNHLQRLGIHHGQGYYFSRPVPAESLETLLFKGK